LIPAIWIVIELIRCGYLPLLTGLRVADKWVLRLHAHYMPEQGLEKSSNKQIIYNTQYNNL